MALLRTVVVCPGGINEVICHSRGRNIGARKRGILRSRSTTWLGKCVGPVVGSIVVAVIAPLFLSRIIPPGGLITRSTFAHTSLRPIGWFHFVFCPQFLKAIFLCPDDVLQILSKVQSCNQACAAIDEILE